MYTKLKTYKENILVPRNIEGRQDKLKQQAIKILGQETIEGDFILESYMLDIPEHIIKVKVINGDFKCVRLDLTKLPKWFEKLTINGSFNCSFNKLITLQYCPQTINGNFYCWYNQLTTLKGCPQTINGDFNCSYNKLESLEYGPKVVNGNFSCSWNKLISLEYGPKFVGKNYNCYNFYNAIKLQRPIDCKINGDFEN